MSRPTTTQTTAYEGPIDDDGILFFRDARLVEFILRGEYGWRGGNNDWQVTLERAVNTLDQKGELFLLSPEGEFVEEPFPEGSGEVAEHRYEATATFGRALFAEARPATRRGRRSLEARAARPRRSGAQVLPAQGQHLARLAARRGLGHQPQIEPQGRADQLLRLPRPAQSQRGPRECRQPRPRAAAKLGAGGRSGQGIGRLGPRPAQALLSPHRRHHRHRADRRGRPVDRQPAARNQGWR